MTKITFDTKGVGLFKNIGKTGANIEKKHSSNPFGIAFKGNVIQADVFQTTSVKNATPIKERGKMYLSAVVGGINSFNDAIKARLNSVVSFGKQVRDNVTGLWQQARNTEVSFDLNELTKFVVEKFQGEYNVARLTKRPVGELETMLKAEIAG